MNLSKQIEAVESSISSLTSKLATGERCVVNQLRRNARREPIFSEQPFRVTRFRNDLDSIFLPGITLWTQRKIPLNDFLLDFLELVASMGIDNPVLCRSCDIEEVDYDYTDDPEIAERRFKFYLENDGTSILDYNEYHNSGTEIDYFNAGSTGRSISITSTNKIIGNYSPKVVFGAYLLSLLDRQQALYTLDVE